MENFVVSARKYRPATFDTVVGQTGITTTLQNALRSSHLAQAFLFCGPRGVGKTTCARILAKIINCQNVGEKVEACGVCDSCQSFNSGHSLNIFELDAASNNSVDDIRNLVSQVSFSPQLGKYKVYIIDEVHMLSQAAFNAFLKTLEEPPKHAVFILATTEKHKIIPTILSRCQIFDFNRIKVRDIASHLEFIARNEGVTAEPDGLHVIAQKADGALRDALTMFDQLVSFSGKTLTYQSVIANLNVLDYDYYFRVTECILQQKISDSLLVFNEILNKGFDGHNFILGLAEHFRNLLVCKDESTLQLLEVSENIKSRYAAQSALTSGQAFLTMLEIANRCDINYKMSKNQRLLVELCLMQLCSLDRRNSDPEKKNSELKILPPPGRENPDFPVSAGHGLKESPGQRPVSQLKREISEGPEKLVVAEEKQEPYQKPVLPLPVNEGGKTSLRRPKLNTRSVSISDVMDSGQVSNTGKEEAGSSSLENRACEPFSEASLIDAWKKFAEKARITGKESLFSVLSMRNPQIKSGNQIEFYIENTVMESVFLQEKGHLMEFLSGELNNFFLEVNLIVKKDLVQKNPYTNREKFMKMAEKNAFLVKMKKQFDLGLD